MSITESMTDREAQIAGLHELADFLTEHPDVPVPYVTVHATFKHPRVLAAWLDGESEMRVGDGITHDARKVYRTFGGLDVWMNVNAEQVGETREVPTVAAEFTPFTIDEIRERAAS